MLRVLLADDNRLVREGWSALLDRSLEFVVVGQARDGQEAVELAVELRPDVILMDFEMPRLNGVLATQQVKRRQLETQVLMVTQTMDEARIRAALEQGARGYVCKNDAFTELIPALLTLQAQRFYFSKTIREQYSRLLAELSDPTPVRPSQSEPSVANLLGWMERTRADVQTKSAHSHILCRKAKSLRAEAKSLQQDSQTRCQRAQAIWRESRKLNVPARRTRACPQPSGAAQFEAKASGLSANSKRKRSTAQTKRKRGIG